MFAVSILIDPVDSLIRYVGVAEDVYARFIQHLNCEDSNMEKVLSSMKKGAGYKPHARELVQAFNLRQDA